MSDEQVAEVLDQAAQLIDERGLNQDGQYARFTGTGELCYCTLGAIRHVNRGAAVQVEMLLLRFVDHHRPSLVGMGVASWNDRLTDPSESPRLLRDTAEWIRKGRPE